MATTTQTQHDYNMVTISGRLAATPEYRQFDSGSDRYKIIVTVRQNEPVSRLDLIPVTIWQPDETTRRQLDDAQTGSRVWLTGSVQRRFWDSADGRRSRLEVVANAVTVSPQETT